jgi:hypothetical protein
MQAEIGRTYMEYSTIWSSNKQEWKVEKARMSWIEWTSGIYIS